MSNKTVKPMEEMYHNDDSVCNSSVVNDRGSSSSKKRLYVVIISLGILSVGLLTGLIRLGFHTHALSSSAAGLSKDNLIDRLQASNDQLSAMTKERDQLNATLLQLSNEVTRLQGLSRWSMFRGSCYLLSATTGSWYEGRADCRKRGGDLVVIDDDDEQKFVATLTGWSAWIGLTDQDTEGSWKWVDGTSLSSELRKMWEDYQPDNGGGNPRNGEEDCVHIFNNLKKWNDLDCATSMQWICEKSPEC